MLPRRGGMIPPCHGRETSTSDAIGHQDFRTDAALLFPTSFGHGSRLQGYFDWRPKDIDEAVVAAYSNDAGRSWTFQQKVLELRTTCPTMAQPDPDGDVDVPPYANPNNSDNGDDDGQGH